MTTAQQSKATSLILDVTKRKCSFHAGFLTGPNGTCPTCAEEGASPRCEMRYCSVPANRHDSPEWSGYACHLHLDDLVWVESVRVAAL